MKMLKRRIAIFLCMLMAITTVAAVAPVAQETVQAATKWEYGFWGSYGFTEYTTKLSEATTFLNIPKGIKGFSVKDLLSGYAYKDSAFKSFSGDTLKNVKFESKNPDIVSVDAKTGKITAKKKGSALIKATWKGKKLFCAVKVISESEMKPYQKQNKELISISKKINKVYGGKVTDKNAAKLYKLYKQVDKGGNYSYVGYDFTSDDNDFYDNYYLYSMDTLKASNLQTEYYTYFNSISPFATTSSNCFKIASISGKGKTITVNLSKAVTASQLMGAKFYAGEEDMSAGKSDCAFVIYVRDTKTEEILTATATIKRGSKSLTVKCGSNLKKGTKYELIPYDWYDEEFIKLTWVRKGVNTFVAK